MLLAQTSARQSLDMSVPFVPTAVRFSGEPTLVYELHLTNFSRKPISLNRVSVENQDGALVAAYEGPRLLEILGQPASQISASATIASGARSIVYFNVRLPHPRLQSVRYRVEAVIEGEPEPLTLLGGVTALDRTKLPRLAPPLRGGPWAAIYDPSLQMGHRRVLYAVGGRARIPGRFAIDWSKVDESGHISRGRTDRPNDIFGYGDEVLAVADALVAATRDGVAEPEKLSEARSVSIADATGNYISLNLGHDRFAFYEHLKPGLLVKPGDRVHAGQVIAALGFTGQTRSPHLHFHVSDANAPLEAEGRPYHLEGVEELGSFASLDAFDRHEPWLRQAGTINAESDMPKPQAVVRFG
jgi:murein DD-endopeptidase MepM/ murein hydrolase activator NlpD